MALMPEFRIDGGLAARKETVERMLFNPTRRPAPPVTQTAGGATSIDKGRYALTGTTFEGNVATAFLKEIRTGKSVTVRKGETIDGILVADVKADSVRLKLGDQFEDLPLKIAAGPKSTVQTVTGIPGAPGVHGGAPAPLMGEAARLQVLREEQAAVMAAERVAHRPLVQPTAQPPEAGGSAGVTSMGEILAQRRRAAAAAAATGNAPSPRN
ncbi:MAG: hypothetical protein ACHP91_14725 [Burkholderiales bacterium]